MLLENTILKDRYEVIRIEARGGMSLIYRAMDLVSNEWVCVKQLAPELLSNQTIVESFRSEYRHIVALQHPYIVKAYDYLSTEAMEAIILEYVEGERLNDLLRKHHNVGLPLKMAQRWIVELANILTHLHQNQLVHGDIKPSNLIVTPYCDFKLIDFGVSRILSSRQDPHQQDPLRAITPSYATPERLKGRYVMQKDDVFGLGCIAYEMICGMHPYAKIRADHALARDIPLRRLETLNCEQWLALKHCLQLTPEMRSQTVAEMIAAFDQDDDCSFVKALFRNLKKQFTAIFSE